MVTVRQRVNITLDSDTYDSLEILSKKKKQSLSHVGAELISRAMELEEDLYFSKLAEKRLEKDEKRLTGEQVWG